MTIYRRKTELMEAELGDEIVALNADAGECFGFNSVAASVWRQLEQPRSFDQLRDGLLAEYDVSDEQCVRELSELLSDLATKNLITTA